MPSQVHLRRAQNLVDQVLADLAAARPVSEVVEKLKATPRADLLRVRRLIDQQLAPSAPALPIEVLDGGIAFGDWLADELDLDHERAHRTLVFIEEYGEVVDARGYEPTIPELAESTAQSVATINRRLADFRSVFPGERNPARLSRALRNALNDQRLRRTLDESLEASIRDVPVVTTPRVGD